MYIDIVIDSMTDSYCYDQYYECVCLFRLQDTVDNCCCYETYLFIPILKLMKDEQQAFCLEFTCLQQKHAKLTCDHEELVQRCGGKILCSLISCASCYVN